MPDKIEVVHVRIGSTEYKKHTSIPDPGRIPPVIRKIRAKHRRNNRPHNLRRDENSYRSVQLQLSHYEITHDEPSNAEVIDIESQFALPSNLVVTGLLHILLGVVSTSISMVLFFADSTVETYLEASGSHSHSPAFFVFASEGLTIVAGIGLIICLLYSQHGFFRSYPHFLWMIVMLDFAAIIISLGSWRYLNLSAYERMFESEAMIFCEGDYEYYNILWNRPNGSRDPEPRIWGSLESTLRCCGIYGGAQDWARICQGRVPTSCCREKQPCDRELEAWNAAVVDLESDLQSNITNLQHLLFQKPCQKVLVLEANSIQRDWIVFPFIIALFDLLLMISGNHKAREISYKLQSTRGRRDLEEFRIHFWNRLTSKNPRVPADPFDSSEEISPATDQRPSSALVWDPFVTDRESLDGLVQPKGSDPSSTETTYSSLFVTDAVAAEAETLEKPAKTKDD